MGGIIIGNQRMTGPPNPDKPVHPVISSGGVIFNDDDKVLIMRRKVEKIWVLPKGKREEGETLKENALREVIEETGLVSPVIDRPIGIVRYTFFWYPDDVNYNKTVHYFLMKVDEKPELNMEKEFSDYRWAGEEEALRLLKHENDRLITRKGFEIVGRKIPQQ